MSGAGMGVDVHGGPVIDPTENVLALVDAEGKHRDELRAADNRYQDDMRIAEMKRRDDLAALRVYYENILESMRANSLKLLADQLKEMKADMFDRMSKQEQFRWETGGKSTGGQQLWGYILGGLGLAIGATTLIVHFMGKTPVP